MNGREFLNNKLQEKGASIAQLKSKVIDLMLEVLADSPNYIVEDAIKQSLIEARKNAENAERMAFNSKRQYEVAYGKYIEKYRSRDALIEK